MNLAGLARQNAMTSNSLSALALLGAQGNLVPGTYTVSFKNDANGSGVNFSFARLNIDGLRVYKGESSSASPRLAITYPVIAVISD